MHAAPRTILWYGSVLEASGYGRMARDALVGVWERGHRVVLADSRVAAAELADCARTASDLAVWNERLADRLEPDVTLDAMICCRPPVLRAGLDVFARARAVSPNARAHIGVTMLEADRIPASWVEACRGMDRLWVPSSFCADVFASSGLDRDRIDVVHPGVDPSWLFSSVDEDTDPVEYQSASVVFLSVFRWEFRKGWDILLNAYLRAFDRNEDTLLVVRSAPLETGGPTVTERVDAMVRSVAGDPARLPRIEVIEHELSRRWLGRLYRASDAFVLPSRGEGLGLPYLEAMAAGVPVIAPRATGQMDFLDDENAFLIDCGPAEPMTHRELRPPYEATMRWATPSVDHTAALMRRVAEDPTGASRRAGRARTDVHRYWTADHAAARYLRAIDAAV